MLEAGWGVAPMEGIHTLTTPATEGPNREAKCCVNLLKLPVATMGCMKPHHRGWPGGFPPPFPEPEYPLDAKELSQV